MQGRSRRPRTSETLLELDATSPTTSPSIRSSPRTATSTSAATAPPTDGEPQEDARHALHDATASRRTRSIPKSAKIIIEWESDGHNGGAMAFGHDGMLYVTSGDGTSDSDTNVVGQDMTTLLAKVLRIDVDHPDRGKAVLACPKDNPFVGHEGRPAGDLGLRLAQPVADDRRREDRPHLGRQERPGPVGAGVPRQEGRQLRLERHRGQPSVLPEPQAGPDAVRQADRRAPSLRGPLADRRHRLLRQEASRAARRLHLRRLLHRQDLGGQARRRRRSLWHKEICRPRLQITGFGVDSQGRTADLPTIAASDKGGFYTLEPTPQRTAPPTFPQQAERERPVRVGEGARDGAGADPVLGQRRRSGPTAPPRSAGSACPAAAKIDFTDQSRLELPRRDGASSSRSPWRWRRATRTRAAGSRRAS